MHNFMKYFILALNLSKIKTLNKYHNSKFQILLINKNFKIIADKFLPARPNERVCPVFWNI